MSERRSPKELLEYVKKEEKSQSQGKLKIFLGAAPGVGKTYAMLEDALVRVKEGVDVVAGLVESHGRKETEAFLTKLEILPRKIIKYRGREMKEFDLDGALQRHPELILVDELAHTNVPGSRHEKRWQDILELLDKGINVYTTVNVQHIESLNNIVTQITGIPIRETVPDTLLERAQSIELIDLPPEDLIKRLEEGKVYVPTDIAEARENYFRKSNLTALRELALRLTAEQVDMEVLLHRRGEQIKKIIPVTERLLVCVGPDLNTSRLIRATYRMAKRFHAKWIALYVEPPGSRLSIEQKNHVIHHLQLAEQLGAEAITIGGNDIVAEILRFAHERNVTKIVLGKKRKTSFFDYFGRSVTDELVRRSDDIDLYILRGGTERRATKRTSSKTKTPIKTYLIALFTVLACSIINLELVNYIQPTTLILIYFLGIIYVSSLGYFKPAFLASVLSVIIYGLLFSGEGFSDYQSLLTLLSMFLVSLITAYLTLQNRAVAEFSRWREQRMATMHLLSKQLATTRGEKNLLSVAIKHISEVFNCKVMALIPDDNNHLIPIMDQGMEFPLSTKDQSVAQWVFSLGQMAGLGTHTLPDNEAIYIPLIGKKGPVGVLRIIPKVKEEMLVPEQMHLLEGIASQVATAIEVDKLQDTAKSVELEKELDKVRSVLMNDISDNMRAPIQEIITLSKHLHEEGQKNHSSHIQDLSNQIAMNSEELDHLVYNLSQIARLEASERLPNKKLGSLQNVSEAALKSLSRRVGEREILSHWPEDFPLIHFNQVFLEQVFVNIFENALKYSPPNSPIDVGGAVDWDQVVVSIEDRGPGVLIAEINKIFEKFYRGQMIQHVKGMGLGLAICQKIVVMHEGKIWVENREGGGASFRFTLPL